MPGVANTTHVDPRGYQLQLGFDGSGDAPYRDGVRCYPAEEETDGQHSNGPAGLLGVVAGGYDLRRSNPADSVSKPKQSVFQPSHRGLRASLTHISPRPPDGLLEASRLASIYSLQVICEHRTD